MRSSSPLRRLALAVLTSTLAACGGSGDPAPAAPDATYRVRGELVRFTDAGRREVFIRHEAIPDFRSEAGAVVGMEAMTMPFPLASGVSTEGLAAGDRVEFVFEVRWRASSEPMAITSLEKLPAGTRLGFDPPPSEEPIDATEPAAAPTTDATSTEPLQSVEPSSQ